MNRGQERQRKSMRLLGAITALRARLLAAAAGAFTALIAAPLQASEYTVSPMRMELDADTRTTVVTLTNTGSDRIDFQLKATSWTQDGQGKDVYSDTSDVIFFPKIFALEPNETRVVRVGVKNAPPPVEQTYRLFIEKIPAPNPAPPPPGAQVSVNFRFALPIFVKPRTRQASGDVGSAAFERGELVTVIRNTGNEHMRFDDGVSIVGRNAQGAQVYTRKLDNPYVLAGIAKRYAASIPKDVCAQLASVEVSAKTEQFTLSKQIDVNRTNCE
jgi:fimbrial chaperone protein